MSLGWFIGYVGVFNVIGEYGVFLSIILLLERNEARSNSTQSSFQRETLLPQARLENSKEGSINSDSDFDEYIGDTNERRNRLLYTR